MPRIREIKIEPFNEVQMVERGEKMEITPYFERDLREAVNDDHWCQDYQTCDIAVALDAGFVKVAAGILHGATETCHIDAVICAHYFNGTLDEDPRRDMYSLKEWSGWANYFMEHARMCDSCGGANFDVSSGDRCGHCNALMGYKVGDTVTFDRNVNLETEPYEEVEGKVVAVSEWDEKTRNEPIQWLDIAIEDGRITLHQIRSDYI